MLDIKANRTAVKYSRKETLARIAWVIGQLAFRLIPTPLHGLRCSLLRLFGARVGKQVHIYPSVRIAQPWNVEIGDFCGIGEGVNIYSLGDVTIGERTTISQRAHLCAGTHDYRRADLPLLKPPITIGSDAWICAEAFVGPGLSVGDGAVVAARAVVVKDVPSGAIYAGNPARPVGERLIDDRQDDMSGGD